jgi:hypothetical protein
MWTVRLVCAGGFVALLAAVAASHAAAATPVDLSKYEAGCRVDVQHDGDRLTVAWPIAERERGHLVLNLDGRGPLIAELGIAGDGQVGPEASGRTPNLPDVLLADVDPIVFLTVGSRRAPGGKPADQKWQVFFDKPANRPHETFASQLELTAANVRGSGGRASVTLDRLAAGNFSGSLRLSFYAGCRLLHVEGLLETKEDGRAIFYDAGLVGDPAGIENIAWMDTEGKTQRASVDGGARDRAIASRHRTIIAECAGGSIACFPPPHQFHYPRDWSDNFRFVWLGADHRGQSGRFGFGVQQEKQGGGAFVPWFNAPPDVQHRMGVFYLLSRGKAEDALRETLRFTHGDRFPELPGYLTFTTHYHMAIAVAAMDRKQKGLPEIVPDWVQVFKDMNVNMLHLGEFHGDGHQADPGPLRLPEMEAMFHECRRLSDDKLLVIPGEEINRFLGLPEPGKHPGHWMSLFPRPVYWTLKDGDTQPFVEEHEKYGRVYHVSGRGDMIRLIREEHALVWAAHPRIKASSWTPDIFRHEDFFIADYWLGGAWKPMPGDLSQERLGIRVLDLLDDMANWGHKKYVPGEVDVFKIDHTHELYAHMNINYVKIDHLPKYDEGWQGVLDVLRDGKFFVTTGEVLIPEFTVGGKESGDELILPEDGKPELAAKLRWTYPLSFGLVISGDGERVYQDRIDLSNGGAFGETELKLPQSLAGRHWVRLEVWDVAANGAFTQPVWLRR